MLQMSSLRAFLDDFTRAAHQAKETVGRARAAVRAAEDEVRAGAERIRAEATHALGGEHTVIDVGSAPSKLARAGRAATALVVAALAVAALVTFSVFFVELLVALVLATQVLGLRIDPTVLKAR